MIVITYMCGKSYIWTAVDACRAREQYRIVGELVGCLPRAPKQNVQLGLPLQLLPEEATLLVEKGLAKIVDCSSPPPPPTDDEMEKFQALREKLYHEQVITCREGKRAAFLWNIDKVTDGKRAKKRKLQQGTEADKAEPEVELTSGEGEMGMRVASPGLEGRLSTRHDSEAEIEEEVQRELDKISNDPPLSKKHSCVQICTVNPLKTHERLSEAQWSFPQTDHEKLRYKVFCDLWERGYFLSSGGKFGGDFLVYPGDPARFHSFYIAVCLPHRQSLPALDIISMGRLGASVKKTVILCSVEDDGNVRVTSLQWTGIT